MSSNGRFITTYDAKRNRVNAIYVVGSQVVSHSPAELTARMLDVQLTSFSKPSTVTVRRRPKPVPAGE